MNKHLIQIIKNTLVLAGLLSWLAPAEARLSIRHVAKTEKPACISFQLTTDTFVKLKHDSTNTTRTTDISLQGLDIHEEIDAFFIDEPHDWKPDCISNIQTNWTGQHGVVVSFTAAPGLASRITSKQVSIGHKYHTLVHVYTEPMVDQASVDDAASIVALPINKTVHKKKKEALRISMAVMADYGDVVNTNGDLNNKDLGFDSNFEVRRARATVKGQLGNWLYKTRLNFVNVINKNDNDNEATVDRAYIGYTGWKALELRAGLQPEPFGLEKSTSSKYISFMERSVLDTFTPEDNLGIQAISRFEVPLTIQVGAYVERPYPDGSKTDKSVTGRIFYDLAKQDHKLFHLGASYSYREPLDNQVRYKERPEAHLAGNLFKTRRFKNVDWVGLSGLETAYVLGPVSLQAEYVRSRIEQDANEKSRDVEGYYTYISWFITGESRPYANGSFGKIRPRHSVGKSGWGAWELALRYSLLKDNEGQQLTDITYGLNWYLTKTTRVMFNWVYTDYESDDKDGQANIGQMRFQQLF